MRAQGARWARFERADRRLSTHSGQKGVDCAGGKQAPRCESAAHSSQEHIEMLADGRRHEGLRRCKEGSCTGGAHPSLPAYSGTCSWGSADVRRATSIDSV